MTAIFGSKGLVICTTSGVVLSLTEVYFNSSLLFQILLGPLATICQVIPSERKTLQTPEHLTVNLTGNGDAHCKCEEKPPHHNHQEDWQRSVKVLDRLMFVMYVIALVVPLILCFPRP